MIVTHRGHWTRVYDAERPFFKFRYRFWRIPMPWLCWAMFASGVMKDVGAMSTDEMISELTESSTAEYLMADGKIPDPIEAYTEQIQTLRIVMATLLGAVLTGMGAYLLVGQNVVHQSDLQQAVIHYSPYSQDKAALVTQLKSIQAEQAEERQQTAYLRDLYRSLLTQIALTRQAQEDQTRVIADLVARLDRSGK